MQESFQIYNLKTLTVNIKSAKTPHFLDSFVNDFLGDFVKIFNCFEVSIKFSVFCHLLEVFFKVRLLYKCTEITERAFYKYVLDLNFANLLGLV